LPELSKKVKVVPFMAHILDTKTMINKSTLNKMCTHA